MYVCMCVCWLEERVWLVEINIKLLPVGFKVTPTRTRTCPMHAVVYTQEFSGEEVGTFMVLKRDDCNGGHKFLFRKFSMGK